MLVAASEIAQNHAKETSSGVQGGGTPSGRAVRVKQGLALLLIAFQVWQPLLANPVAITPDSSVQGNKPVVTAAGNGVPVVQIVAPNTQGVSLNQFQDYNVPTVGLILNNSGQMTQTQLGGYISGNPQLDNAAASTIVNQVNGRNPSQILGWQEIAGNKANLVISNPNGISINGGGFINTQNLTLTTGKPQLDNGALSGYAVQTGQVTVGEQGLNAKDIDKLSILSRSIQLNGQIWAKHADLITGANIINADGSHTAQATDNNKPTYALDVAALGGMYAQQIRMIGTEQGLGVNNAGKLIAQDQLTLDNQGNLINSGQINSGNQSTLKAQATDNSGQISALNNLKLNSTERISNSGSIIAGSVQLDGQSLSNSGQIQQTGEQSMRLSAAALSNSGTMGIIKADTTPTIDPSTGTVQVENNTAPAQTTGASTSDTATTTIADPVVLDAGHIQVVHNIDNSGQILSSGEIAADITDTLSNSGTIRTAQDLSAKVHTLSNSGTIAGQSSVQLNTQQLSNSGQLTAQSLSAQTNTLRNSGQIQGDSLTLKADGSLDNTHGSIQSERLSLTTPKLNNTQGLLNTGAGKLSLDNDELNNTSGRILANQLTLNNQTLDNTSGVIGAERITLTSADVNNNQGLIQATDTQIDTKQLTNTNNRDQGIIGTNSVTVQADHLNNSQGRIAAGKRNQVTVTQELNNTGGQIIADQVATLTSDSLSNQSGLIQANDLTLNTRSLSNSQSGTDGGIIGVNNLTLSATEVLNNAASGKILSGNSAGINTAQLNNTDGSLIQAKALDITAKTIDNSNTYAVNTIGGLVGTDTLKLKADSVNNTTGYIAGGLLTLQTPTLINKQGLIATEGDLSFTQSVLDNQEGGISARNLSIDSEQINNQSGRLLASQTLNAQAAQVNNQGGILSAGGQMTVQGGTLNNQAGLVQGKNTTIISDSINNQNTLDANNSQGIFATETLTINSTDLLNQTGRMAAGSVTTTAQNLNNTSGSIQAQIGLNVTGSTLNNTQGSMAAGGETSIHAGELNNSHGQIASNSAVSIQATSASNTSGQILSDQALTLKTGQLTNQSGLIQGAGLNVEAGQLINTASGTTGGLIASKGALQVNADTVDNHTGYMAGQTATLTTQSVDNQSGQMTGVDALSISTSTLNNNAGKVQSSGTLDIDAHTGTISNQHGIISTTTNAQIKAGSLDNTSGQLLSAQTTTVQANLVQNDQGLIRASDLSVTAPTIHNTHSGETGGMVGDNRLSVTASSQLDNQAGYLAGGTTQIHTADFDNQQGQVIGTTDLAINASQLNNSAGTIAGNANLTITGQSLNNQAGTVSAQKDLTLSVGQINNTQGTLLSKANQTITSDQLTNTAGWIQAQQLTIGAGSITNDNQMLNNALVKGTLLGNESLTIKDNALLNNSGWIQAGDETHAGQASIGSTTLNNGGIVQSGQLTVNSTTLNNQTGQLIAKQDLGITATDLDNQQGLVYAVGKATLNASQIDNSNTQGNAQTGIQANSVLVQGNSTFNNTSGQVLGNTLDLSSQDLNNTSGQVSGNDVTVNATHLNNASGQLLANNQLTLTTQNYTHQGTIQGNNGTTLNLSGDFTNQGTLSSSGSLGIHTDGNITNTSGSTLSSGNTLSLSGQNITNQADATIKAAHTQLTANDTILNDGTIDGTLTELRAGNQIINNHKVYGGDFEGNGGILIGTNNLINNQNAVIASRSQMNIGAHNITNNLNGLIQTQGDLSIGRDLGTQAQNYAVTGMADSLINNSATIEVGGNAQWGVADTQNRNTQFAVEMGPAVTKDASYYVVNGQQVSLSGNRFVTYRIYATDDPIITNSLVYGDSFDSSRNSYPQATRYNQVEYYYGLKTGILSSNDIAMLHFNKPNLQVEMYEQEISALSNYYAFIEGVTGVLPPTLISTQGEVSVNNNSFFTPYWYFSDKAYQQRVLDTYGWKSYESFFMTNQETREKQIQFISLAYNPTRYAYGLHTVGKSQDLSFETIPTKYLLESFTYDAGDPIWSAFELAGPDSVIPAYPGDKPTLPQVWNNRDGGYTTIRCDVTPGLSSCSTYNEQLATYNNKLSTYSAWADQNRDKYIALNRKILEFNDRLNAQTVLNYSMFNGTESTNTPVVKGSTPGKIIVSGDMSLAGHITNDKSQIVVGGALLGNVTGIDDDNAGATVQVVTTYNGTLREVQNGRVAYETAANPAPTIETLNLSIAETKINVGAQNIATVAGALNTSVSSVDTSGQTNLSNTSVAGKDNATASLTNASGINGAQLSAQNGANLGNISTGQSINGNDVQSQTTNPTGSPITSVPAGESKEIRTVAFNGILPSNLLFNVSKDPNASYIVETDPQFTDKKQFLGSAYMLGQFDPNKQWQHMGDGLYEQKLVTDQIITATGKRYVGDYTNNEAQYKALMDNGITVGKAFNLTVGTALTAEQMAKLTSNIVWMVEETVTLADGTRVKALVPKVYLVANTLDLKGDGTLIASKNNFLNVTGTVNNNGGTIAAFNAMDMNAQQINNHGGIIGGNKGSDITLRTTGDLNNIGGTLRGGNLALDVGGNLNSQTTTYHTQTGDMSVKDRPGYASVRDGIDQIASIQALDANHSIKDAEGNDLSQTALNIQAKGDINLKASNLTSAGDSYISGKDINLTTVNTGFAENAVYTWSGKNKHRTERSDSTEIGTGITSTGDLTLNADQAINIRAGTLIADKDLTVVGNTINIDAGRTTHTDYSETYTKTSGFLSSKTSHSIDSNTADTTVGSQLIGDSVTTLSKDDTNVRGSTIYGTNGVDLISTEGNVNLLTSEDRFNEYDYRKETKSGFGALGGISFGKMSNEQGRTGDKLGHTGSTIASTNGDINLMANQGKITVEASDINSQHGNVALNAQSIALTDVHNTATEDQYTKFKSAGLSVNASVAGISAVQNAAQTADLLGQAGKGSQSVAGAASTAFAAYNAYRGVKDLANGIGKLGSAASATDVASALGASVSISLGVQKSESKSHAEQAISAGSSINAGGQVSLNASGAGKDSDISLTNAQIAGQKGTALTAEGDIIAQAGVNSSSINSSNKSSGGSIGVSFGSSGFTLNLSVNGAKGKANGTDTNYSETVIGSSNSTTTLSSGGDTTLDGAIAQGKHVKADVGGNLTINTPQDTNTYDSKQTSYGVGISIPLGAGAFGVSGSFSNDTIKANTTTTKEVAGIQAGMDGFDVNVKGQTTLDGGVIASTATPDKNQLVTGTLIVKDKANSSDYDADSIGLSASYSGKETVKDKDGKIVPKLDDKGQQVQSGVKGLNAGLPSVMSAKDSADSTAHAGISAGNLVITDEAGQQQLTGQSAEQTIAEINRDTNGNATLSNLYEQDKQAIQTGFAITKGLSQNFNTFMNIMVSDMDKAGKQAAVGKDGKPLTDEMGQVILGKDGKPMTVKEAYQDLNLRDQLGAVNVDGQKIDYATRQELWGSGGTGNIIATALIGATSGNVTGGAGELVKNTAINVVRAYGATEIKQIADEFMDVKDGKLQANGTSETVRGLLHAIAGCAGASATGGSCADAAVASGGTVAVNNALGALLNLDPSTMTEAQKQAYSNLMGTLVSGVTSAVGGDTAAAQLATKVEEDNNQLAYGPAAQRLTLLPKLIKGTISPQELILLEALNKQDILMRQKIEDACGGGKAGTGICKDFINNVARPYYNTFPKSGLSKDLQVEKNAWGDVIRKYDVAIKPTQIKPKVQDPYAGGNPVKILSYLNQHPELNTQHIGDPFGHQALQAAPGVVLGLGAVALAGPAGGAAATTTQAGKVTGAIIGAVANATSQYANPESKGNIKPIEVVVSGVTGYLAPSYGFQGNIGLSITGYNAGKLVQGEIPTYSGMTASGLGSGLGYGLGKAGASIQWSPVKTPISTSWQLPSYTDRLPAWVLPVTTTSNVPAQMSEHLSPFAEEYITNAIEDNLLPKQPQNNLNK